MMQPTEVNNPVPDYVWAWTVTCPECRRKTLLHMNESQLQERRIFLINEDDNSGEGEGTTGCALSGPLTCQRCESPSYIKFELNEDDILVTCLTQDPDAPTPMSAPERRPTIGNHFSKN